MVPKRGADDQLTKEADSKKEWNVVRSSPLHSILRSCFVFAEPYQTFSLWMPSF